jgi:hypothetical protein
MRSIEEIFKNNLDFLLSDDVVNGKTDYSYIIGLKKIKVTIEVIEE